MKLILLILTWCYSVCLLAQINPKEVVAFSDSMMRYAVEEQMIPGGILSIVSSDQIHLAHGYGFSNLENQVAASADETLFQLGSVGKVFTAIAALQQVDQGKLDITRDVNHYLTDWKVDHSNDPLTLFHLLTHTGGFNERFIGYMARSETELLSLGDHLLQNMPSQFQPPGIDINYSNYGYAMAGHLVELSSGECFDQYIQSQVFDRVGMIKATYHLPDHYHELRQFATGYQWHDEFEEIRSYPRHALPAGSLIATAADMGMFMQELLQRDTTWLSASSFDRLFSQQFTNDPLLPGYTLGLEVQHYHGRQVFVKGGQVPGFLSFVLFIPEKDLGLFLSFNTDSDDFLELFLSDFERRFFPKDEDDLLQPINEDVTEYAGHYGNLRTSFDTFEGFFLLFQGHFELQKTSDNLLRAYHNGGWQTYQLVKEDVFQHTTDPDEFITFQRNKTGKVIRMYRSQSVGGVQVPSSYFRLKWWERPRFLNDEYPVALLVILIYLVLPLVWLMVHFIRKKNQNFLTAARIPPYYHIVALGFMCLFFWNIVGFFIPLLKNRDALLFGLSEELLSIRYYNISMALFALALLVLSSMLWINKEGNLLMRVYYTTYSLVAFSYITLLFRWHFLLLE